jgi:hypothetical protein
MMTVTASVQHKPFEGRDNLAMGVCRIFKCVIKLQTLVLSVEQAGAVPYNVYVHVMLQIPALATTVLGHPSLGFLICKRNLKDASHHGAIQEQL